MENLLPKDIVVSGGGGHSLEVLWTIEAINEKSIFRHGTPVWNVMGVIDDDLNLKGKSRLGYELIGNEKSLQSYSGPQMYFHCAIGKNSIRETFFLRLEKLGWKPATLIHPSAKVARNVEMGEGSYIAASVVITPDVKVGRGVIVNTQAGIYHESSLGDFSNLCPGVRVCGGCRIGNHSFIGTGAILNPNIQIGSETIIGAGSVVIRSIDSQVTAVGVPARVIKRFPTKAEDSVSLF